MKVILKKDYKEMAWKNGLGTTKEIFKKVDDEQNLLFRVSKAQINSDSAFSKFENLQRILLVLNGNGISINNKDNFFKDEIFKFSGDQEINAKLINGPVEDFNIIWNPNFSKIEIQVLKSPHQGAIPYQENVTHFFFNKEGSLKIDDHFFSEEAFVIIDSCTTYKTEGVTYYVKMLKEC